MEAAMVKKDAHGFELDKNDFVMLTKSNAELAQKKVDSSAKDADGKKSVKTRKTLSAIREDDLTKNDLYQLVQGCFHKGFRDGFLDIIKKINDTNSTRLSKEEQEYFANHVASQKDSILERIKQGDVSIVNDLAKAGINANQKRYNFSFASKFCTYISRYAFKECDKFTPYDNVLQNILPYYAWAYCGDEKVDIFKKNRENGYSDYIAKIRKIIANAQKLYGKEGNLTLKEFDRLLWYKYKGLLGEDLIGNSEFKLIKET